MTRTTPFLLCFKVKGMWDMVFWQRTQKQKVLMVFPYGLKTRIPLCLLLTMTEETNKAVFIFFNIMFYFEPIKNHFSQTCPWKRLVFFA